MKSIHSIRLDGFLSFAPGSPALELGSLNVLIGPNGSGKSNFIEAFGLLNATPQDLGAPFRSGGGSEEWIWKGQPQTEHAALDVVLAKHDPVLPPLRYRLEFSAVRNRVEILDEVIEEIEADPGEDDVFFHYRYQKGDPVIGVRTPGTSGYGGKRRLRREGFLSNQSVLAQRKDPEQYPDVYWVGQRFSEIQLFRDWTFGCRAPLRDPQAADLPADRLDRYSENLALVLQEIEHRDATRFNAELRRFFPRFRRMSTKTPGGRLEYFLHEDFEGSVPATRLSDGTIRFIAILATLLAPSPPPLVCIEEPELGLHPDAVAQVAELLVEASARMQLIVTTHSESLVSALTECPDAVITCERPGPATTLHRLDPEHLKGWLNKNYSLGDLWGMGELGANP